MGLNPQAFMPMPTNARKKAIAPEEGPRAVPSDARLPPSRGASASKRAGGRKSSAEGVRGKASIHVATQVRAHKTREAILKAATRVFARNGFTDGKIESISRLSRTHDRMIYYYFGSKAQLFVEVLETAYEKMNEAEAKIDIDLSEPVDALTTVVHFVWQYYLDHPEFITLLNSENLLKGRHIKKSARASQLSSPAVAILDDVLRSGVQLGLFRSDKTARDLYIEIAALGYFYLSNRYTLSVFLNSDLRGKGELEHWKSVITDTVLRSVLLKLPE